MMYDDEIMCNNLGLHLWYNIVGNSLILRQLIQAKEWVEKIQDKKEAAEEYNYIYPNGVEIPLSEVYVTEDRGSHIIINKIIDSINFKIKVIHVKTQKVVIVRTNGNNYLFSGYYTPNEEIERMRVSD